LTVGATPGLELGMKAEVDQRVLGLSRDEVDRTAAPTVAAVGPAPRDELLTPEAEATVAAIAGR
jgi:hypothetical protein